MTATDSATAARPVLVLWRTTPPLADTRVEQAGWHSDVVYGAPSPRLALDQVLLRYHIDQQDLLEAACYDLPALLADGDGRVHGQRTDTEAVAARLLAEADQMRAWREAQPAALAPSAQLRDLHASLGVLADALLGALTADAHTAVCASESPDCDDPLYDMGGVVLCGAHGGGDQADPDPTPDEDAALTAKLRHCHTLIADHARDQAQQ